MGLSELLTLDWLSTAACGNYQSMQAPVVQQLLERVMDDGIVFHDQGFHAGVGSPGAILAAAGVVVTAGCSGPGHQRRTDGHGHYSDPSSRPQRLPKP